MFPRSHSESVLFFQPRALSLPPPLPGAFALPARALFLPTCPPSRRLFCTTARHARAFSLEHRMEPHHKDRPRSGNQRCIGAEKLSSILDKHINEAITSAVRDATGYDSEFRKGLKEQMKQALPHGLGIDDVVKFQQVLNASLRDVLKGANGDAISAALKECVDEVMPDVPAELKLSKLLEEAREGFGKERHEPFYAFWEPTDYGGGRLYLDREERPSKGYGGHGSRESVKYNAEFNLAVNSEGEVYSMRLCGKDLTPSSRPTVITRLESILMAMYVGRTRLIVDMDDDEVEGASGDQYD